MRKINPLNSKVFLVLLAVLVSISIIIGGYYYYTYERDRLTRSACEQLQSIARYKVIRIQEWLRNRRLEASALYRNPFLEKGVAKLLASPADRRVRENLISQLSFTRELGRYHDVFLVDRDDHVLISFDPSLTRIDPVTQELIRVAGQDLRVHHSDLYRCEVHHTIHYDIVIPVLDPSGAGSLAALVLRIDPDDYLYPLIQDWPAPSRSSETLIVRKEGDSVLFLNKIKFRPDAALSLKIPLTDTVVPAVKAVRGREGISEGIDYRGVRVLSYLGPVGMTSWFMVAKIDRSEILEELSYRMWIIFFVEVILILLTGMSVSRFYYSRQRDVYRKLAESEEKFHKSVLFSPVPMMIHDESGRCLELSKGWTLCSGYTPADIPTYGEWTRRAFGGQEDFTRSQVDRLFADNEPYSQGMREIRTPDGQSRFWDMETIPIGLSADKSRLMLTIAVDITEQHHRDIALRQVNRELERSNKELEQFAYVASHDLQEPLRMISSFTQLLGKRYKSKLDADADDFIGFIVDGAARMQRLIQDLLSFSRINTRGDRFREVDMHLVLGEAVSNLQTLIGETGALVVNGDLPGVWGDYGQLVQLLQNLIGNGIKFHGDKPPRIEVTARQADHEWIFSVKDNGIGIESQYFERIFLIFQRLQSGNRYPGTGIGLAICHRIVNRHEGRIWIESEPGTGSTFHFTLKEGKQPSREPERPAGVA
ncbi:MAG TPA: ATP-binding protein [Bacteroidales bacterium]|nr:ATP-binding protein [Bacteroidales bacterium]